MAGKDVVPSNEEYPSLEEKWQDATAAMTRAGMSYVPGVGPLLAEWIGSKVKNQRLDRVITYIELLRLQLEQTADRLDRLSMDTPEAIDLFERGAEQAARAESVDRKQRIARLVANGITGDDKAKIESRRLLDLFEQIDDVQIIILMSFSRRIDDDFLDKHESVIYGDPANLNSTQEEIDSSTVHELGHEHLRRLGLIEPKFRSVRRGEQPEFDFSTGMIKSSSMDITALGRLLLRRIALDQESEDDDV